MSTKAICGSSTVTTSQREDTADGFFRLLLNVESNISPDEPLPAEVDYWAVEAPGRLRRNPADGKAVPERITFSAFLDRTGVAGLASGPGGLAVAQYAVINPWGFVGYQFGEALLIDLQYYRPAVETVTVEGQSMPLPSYYASALPESTWQHGRTRQVFYDEAANIVRVGTDVNTWQGTFTGRDGVSCLADLRTRAGQLAVLRNSLRHNAAIVEKRLPGLWSPERPGPPAAAVMAAAHLCGPWALLDHLERGTMPADETGTMLTTYLRQFAHTSLTPDDLR